MSLSQWLTSPVLVLTLNPMQELVSTSRSLCVKSDSFHWEVKLTWRYQKLLTPWGSGLSKPSPDSTPMATVSDFFLPSLFSPQLPPQTQGTTGLHIHGSDNATGGQRAGMPKALESGSRGDLGNRPCGVFFVIRLRHTTCM